MSLLIETTIKVSSIMAVALTAGFLLRKRSAALRHWTLAAAILCAALLPLLQPVIPAWSIRLSVPAAIARSAGSPSSTAASTASWSAGPNPGEAPAASARRSSDASRWLGLIWLIGASASLLGLTAGLARLAWLAARARHIQHGDWPRMMSDIARANGLKRPIVLLQSDHPGLLVTWGFRRPKVILPPAARDWSAERMRVVLLHELAHIRRGDWLTQLLAECLRSVYWFNPLVWVAARRLRQESEHACDDAVLNGGVDGSDYAVHLLALARSVTRERRTLLSGYPAPAMARPSSLERRFSAMLNGQLNRHPATWRARATTTMAVTILTLFVAGLGLAQTFSSFSGSVFDSTNRVLPGVTLHLTNSQTNAKYEIQTDKNGRFEFVGLPPGEYSWQTALAGFAEMKGTVAVEGRNIQRDLTLQVGSLQETISVYGAGSPTAPMRRSPGDVAEIRRKANESVCSPGTAPVPGAIGGNIKAPRKLIDVRPRYPENLSASGIGGVVQLNALIDTNGDVSEVSVVKSPSPDLEVSAIEAVRQWQFTSTVLNCVPIEVKMTVHVNFVAQ